MPPSCIFGTPYIICHFSDNNAVSVKLTSAEVVKQVQESPVLLGMFDTAKRVEEVDSDMLGTKIDGPWGWQSQCVGAHPGTSSPGRRGTRRGWWCSSSTSQRTGQSWHNWSKWPCVTMRGKSAMVDFHGGKSMKLKMSKFNPSLLGLWATVSRSTRTISWWPSVRTRSTWW